MKQNKYDEESFFAEYSRMGRSERGLEEAGEWHALRRLLPDFHALRVLDLGCGFGWHCRYAAEQGAQSVLGIDLSARMLEKAREHTLDPRIEYRQAAIEDIGFAPESLDVVLSSLALHYVERLDLTFRAVYDCLVPGGRFIFSIEHPVFTALPGQDWHYGPSGEKLHWPIDGYADEGRRDTRFLGSEVAKYHRTVSTLINTVIEAGFVVQRIEEPLPDPRLIDRPGMKDEWRRPMFLLIAAQKGKELQ